MKRITKRSLGNTSDSGELFQGSIFAVMLIDEIHGPANNLFSRNLMPTKFRLGFMRRGQHVADLSDQLLR